MKKIVSDASAPNPRKKRQEEGPSSEVSAKLPPSKPRRQSKKADSVMMTAAVIPPKPQRAPEGVVSPTLTVVAARIDIGFGNHLFLRGSGPGLNWEAGVPMANAGSDLWTIDLIGACEPICCKFLINDEKWSAGPDYVIDPGAQLEVTPLF